MGWDNHYFAFKKSADIFVLAGHVESNTWVGRCRALDPVYRKVRVEKGDQIHDLCGGAFLVRRDGLAFENPRLEEPFVRHIFLKGGVSYSEKTLAERYPDALVEIQKAAAFQTRYRDVRLPVIDETHRGLLRASTKNPSENVALVMLTDGAGMGVADYPALPEFEIPADLQEKVESGEFSFVFDSVRITDPWSVEDGRGSCDPLIHYGEPFIHAVIRDVEKTKDLAVRAPAPRQSKGG